VKRAQTEFSAGGSWERGVDRAGESALRGS